MNPRATPAWIRLVSAAALTALVAVGCGATDGTAAPTSTEAAALGAPSRTVSAEAGATARLRFEPLKRSAEGASDQLSTGSFISDCPTAYVPTAEEIAESNAATTGLVDAFERFGVAHTISTDEVGFVLVDFAVDDVVAQSVASSYWEVLYPVEPISQEELDAAIADNAIIAEQFEAAGIAYTLRTDESGYEILEYDYDDPSAQAAMEQAWLILSPPQPPTPEQLSQQNADNALLASAFDDAGVAYELVSDELGWAWLEWDFEDPVTSEAYFRIIDELYPPVMIDPIVECAPVDDGFGVDVSVLEGVPVEETVGSIGVDGTGLETVPADVEPIPVDADRSAAEITALVEGFSDASVEHRIVGDAPWQTVIFDLQNDASIAVVSAILAART
jgi:hypothetical protein